MSSRTDLLFCLKFLKTKIRYLLEDKEVILTNTSTIKPKYSICTSVNLIAEAHSLLPFAVTEICYYSHTWSEYSGNMWFPISLPETFSFFSIKNKWINEYGEARIRLLDHLIKELENESN